MPACARREIIREGIAPLTLEKDHLGDLPSASGLRASDKGLSPMSLDEYLKLLD